MASAGSLGEDRPLPSSSLPQVFQSAAVKAAMPCGPEAVAPASLQPVSWSICAARADGVTTVQASADLRSQGP